VFNTFLLALANYCSALLQMISPSFSRPFTDRGRASVSHISFRILYLKNVPSSDMDSVRVALITLKV
jgi:hypothetical protein